MFDLEYTYAVARLRALEVSLFSQATIEQLISCGNEAECLQFLRDQGWGDEDTPMTTDAILNREKEKTWDNIRSMRVDMKVFDVLSYPSMYHNLKAAIKECCLQNEHPGIYMEDAPISGPEIYRILQEKEYHKLPGNMSAAAQEAYESLLHNRDGQLCDVIVDKAALEAIYQAGKTSEEEIIRLYAEDTVAIADIKIAVRAQRTAKSVEFMKRAMVECKGVSVEALTRAAASSKEALSEYLATTSYAEGAQALMDSPSAFERWCDNRIIQIIKPQKYQSFSVGPLVAYVLARENEIKTVRIIISCKANGLPDDAIRERVREMYV